MVNGFDSETTGLRLYHGDRMFAFCIADENYGVYRERTKPGCRSALLQDWLWDTSIEKTVHHLKFDYAVLVVEEYDIPEDTIWHCTLTGSQILRNLVRDHSLSGLVYELGGDPGGEWAATERKIEALGKAYNGYQNIPAHLMDEYQRIDGVRLMLCHNTFIPELQKDPQGWRDYRNEIALILATQRMEQRGIMLDMEGVDETIGRCEREVVRAREDLGRLVGPDDYFNMSSDEDIRRLLFQRFNLPIIKLTDKTRQPKVDKDVLAELRETHPHEVLDIIQRYRSYQKGYSIIGGYKALADPENVIHPNIKTNFARTGREACDNPNLQNVSKDKNRKNPYIVSARGCFRARPGCTLVDIDQSGIEIRMIVEAAGPGRMMERMQAGEHPHIIAAEGFYGDAFRSKAEDKDMYDAGKNGHFCICYGGGLETFAETVMLPMADARRAYEWYYREFPEIATLAHSRSWEVRRTHEIVTPFGRVLRIPHGKHYIWLNYYIQGGATGVIKRNQVRIDDYIRRYWSGYAWMILTVHDSVMKEYDTEVFYKHQRDIYHDVSHLMTHVPEISVPLEVEWKVTEGRWSEAQDFSPETGTQMRLAL